MKKTQPKTETPPAAVPDWVTETPEESSYNLLMWDGDGDAVENIDPTRVEYIALKQYLAGLRGIVPAVPEAPDVLQQTELQSVFDDLEIVNLKILGYRRRILAGATIEDGPLTTEWEDQEPGDESPRDESWFKFSAYGLEICSAEYSQALKARAVAEPGTAPQPKLDPMSFKLYNHPSPEEEREVRQALLARLQQQFASMTAMDIQSVARYADIVDAETGCNTPAEEFITGLVDQHYSDGLTPDDVGHDMEQFRVNFDDMVRDARAFTARYPEAVKSATAA